MPFSFERRPGAGLRAGIAGVFVVLCIVAVVSELERGKAWALLPSLAATFALLVGLGLLISRSLLKPLPPQAQPLRAAASAHLAAWVAGDGRQEITELMLAMQGMRSNLERVIGEIHLVAERAGAPARTQASQFGEPPARRRISEKLSLIDDIAFQTNILALNAAVQAARADVRDGSVAAVAGEAHSLALRSALATEEVRELVEAGVGQSESGASLANDAAERLSRILQSVRSVAALVEEIAAAGRTRAGAIGQIGAASRRPEAPVQADSATLEKSAAVAARLNEQACKLHHVVPTVRTAQAGPAPRP